MITTQGLGCLTRAIIYLFIYLFILLYFFLWLFVKRSYFPVLGVEVQIKVARSLVKN